MKFPNGETRPEAFCAKRPLGTAEAPVVIMGRLSGGGLGGITDDGRVKEKEGRERREGKRRTGPDGEIVY